MSIEERRKDIHRRAQAACYRSHGDWRYEPGSKWHRLRWRLPAQLGAWRQRL